ncbi:MAG: NAD(P)-binding protein [Betaproteobacteria bacterium]
MAESLPSIVVGARPAGLATAAVLRQHDMPVTVLERGTAVGMSWRRHYAGVVGAAHPEPTPAGPGTASGRTVLGPVPTGPSQWAVGV